MKYDAIVVGAGFGGMYMLHRLRQDGYKVLVLEAGDDVGGTWYWNRYPGARCDVQSLDYSFSFDEALQQEWEWSEKYATQPEILRYAQHVAERFDLRRDIQFETRVEAARFDAARERWEVTTAGGEVFDCQFYIMASGCLSVPKDIDIPGYDTFQGRTYHTARWPHEGVDFSGQRVAVIGTGSSAIQSIPIIAEQAKSLTVFQRTPAYSLPAFNRPLEAAEVAERKQNYAEYRERARRSLFGVPDLPMGGPALEATPQEREATYEEGWQQGTLVHVLQSYSDLLTDNAANETAAEFVRNKIRSIVHDPETAEALCAKSFPFGTKRSCLDTNYYATFNHDHVSLIDLRKDSIREITANGIRTEQHELEFDAIVTATGFDAMTGALVNVDICGRDGVTLKDKWADGPRTMLGLSVAGFPNFFTITGPGSPSVMSNMILSIEQHVEWIAACMNHMKQHGYRSIEASEQAEQAWITHVNEVADTTLFPQANSWYMGANVPGKPRVFMPYIGGCALYREKCEEVVANNYQGFSFSAGEADLASAG